MVLIGQGKPMEVKRMPKRHKDPSKVGLSAPSVEGQGTTSKEYDNVSKDSARRKTKRK